MDIREITNANDKTNKAKNRRSRLLPCKFSIVLYNKLVVCLSTNGERALNYTIVKFDFNN